MKENVVDEREAAKYVGMSVSFLRQARMEGNREGRTPGPPFVKIGKSVRYLIADLDTWLRKNRKGAPVESVDEWLEKNRKNMEAFNES